MAKDGGYYFISRPRRFGKSLLVTTLEAYFQGRKELFDGLAISELEKEWKQYPVLHIDLNAAKYTTPQALISIIDGHLRQFEQSYGKVPEEDTVSERFKGVIKRAYEQTGQQVVILVDEYDKPLLEAIGNPELQNDYRTTLKSFYGVAKTMDSYIRFAFFTGVTIRGDLRYHGEGDPRQIGCTSRGDGRVQRNEQGGMLRKIEKTV